MYFRVFVLATALNFWAAPYFNLATAAWAAPANTLKEVFNQLSACLSKEAGGEAASRGAEMTLRFSLRRDGSLIGKPHITYSKLPKEEADKRRVMETIAGAMDRCLPVKITDGLGGAIAGRMMSYRFEWKGRETGI